MEKNPISNETGRRQFIARIGAAGCLACLSPLCLGKTLEGFSQEKASQHKFSDDAQWSYEQIYKHSFVSTLLPNLNAVADQIGRERLIGILRTAATERAKKNGANMALKAPKADFDFYNSWTRETDRFWQHVVTYSIVVQNQTDFEFRVTECLWAKTFREAHAEDYGAAIVCNADYGHAEGYSSHLTLTRTRTLMQGNDYCNHHYHWNP